jgi:hypothetical protein
LVAFSGTSASAALVAQYTFNDATADDQVGSADGVVGTNVLFATEGAKNYAVFPDDGGASATNDNRIRVGSDPGGLFTGGAQAGYFSVEVWFRLPTPGPFDNTKFALIL